MDHDALNIWAKRAADWARDYHAGLRARPVRPDIAPGSVAAQLPKAAPDAPEPMERIFEDFEALVPGATTHWQHPRFFAYFPANASPASMLAEQLVNAMGAQGMLWQTNPAGTELEEVMIGWLRDALGLAGHFRGTVHDSATSCTLAAVLTMRERALGWRGNEAGLSALPRVRLYASAETHNSVDRAARIAGIGQENLVKVPTNSQNAMDAQALDRAIRDDLAAGYLPAGVICATGGTSIGAFDDIAACLDVARAHDLYSHVDAAWAGSAMICPEFRALWQGVDGADSIVFNPHKWLGVQFDCAVQFLADPAPQIRTLAHKAAFLETPDQAQVTDFSEWTVPLGRRNRALKIWFHLRAYGLEGLRARIRNHVAWSAELAERIAALPDLRIVTPPALSLFTFAMADDAATDALLARINADGRIYLTQTKVAGQSAIRVQVGQFDCTFNDVMMVEQVLTDLLQRPVPVHDDPKGTTSFSKNN